MKNPCTRDCPERYPGCNCERRQAWKFQQARIREAKRRERTADDFMIDSILKTKRNKKKGWKKR